MLADLLPQQAWHFGLLLVRISIMLALFPNIGQSFVLPRIRFLLGFFLALTLLPVLSPLLPPQPQDFNSAILILVNEAMIAILIGTVARFAASAMSYAGSFFALLIGMSNASLFNPLQAQQSVLPAVFLGLFATTALFVTDLHHILFLALADSYSLFVPGTLPYPPGDFAKIVIDVFAKSFELGFRLAAPFFIVAILLYTLMGVIARLIPQMQVFFVILPVQIWVGFLLLAVVLIVMMGLFLKHFQEQILPFLAP